MLTANARLRFAPTGTTGAYNLRFEGAAGDTFTVRIEAPVATPVPRSFWTAGAGYNVTGALGSFNAVPQLKPRGAADIQSVVPIATAKQDSGKVVLIEGVVTVATGTFRTQNDNAYMQDGSSGVQLFNLPTTLGLAVGDSIRVAGIMGAFAEERQILRFSVTSLPVVFRLGTTTPPAPRTVTGLEIKGLSFQGELVSATNVQLVAAPSPGTAAYNLNFVHAATDTFQVRIEAGVVPAVPRTGFWTSGAFYDLTGVLGRFNAVAQLKPRGAADIVAR